MKVNEIFYSLQGEGFFTGTPSIFIRFSGCNLRCPFCDTDHGAYTEMTKEEIIRAIKPFPATHVILTGGEPSIQVTSQLIDLLHAQGKFVAIETNGTNSMPDNIDWITLSPKDNFVNSKIAVPQISKADEIKVVFDGKHMPDYPHIQAKHRFIQPCDTGNPEENRRLLNSAISYCLSHPEWRLSLQMHKIIHIR